MVNAPRSPAGTVVLIFMGTPKYVLSEYVLSGFSALPD
jgi:hypothetical protein